MACVQCGVAAADVLLLAVFDDKEQRSLVGNIIKDPAVEPTPPLANSPPTTNPNDKV